MKIYNSLTSDIENEFFYKKSENEIQKNYVLLNNNEILDTNLMEEISECYFSENNSTKDWFIEDQLFSLGTSIANLSTNVNKQSDDEQKKSENLLETKTSEVYYCEKINIESDILNSIPNTFKAPFELMKFVKKIQNDKKFYCTICYKFSHKYKNCTRNHVESKHFPKTFIYTCDNCKMSFFSKNSLSMHRSRKHKK